MLHLLLVPFGLYAVCHLLFLPRPTRPVTYGWPFALYCLAVAGAIWYFLD